MTGLPFLEGAVLPEREDIEALMVAKAQPRSKEGPAPAAGLTQGVLGSLKLQELDAIGPGAKKAMEIELIPPEPKVSEETPE